VHKKGVSHSHNESVFGYGPQQSLRQSPGWGLSARRCNSHSKGKRRLWLPLPEGWLRKVGTMWGLLFWQAPSDP